MSRKRARTRRRSRGMGKPAGDPRSQRRKAYARLFRRVGLEGTWQRLPKRCREALCSQYRPVHWRVQPTARARRHERAAVVAALVEEVLDDRRFGHALGDDHVTIRETMDLLVPLAERIETDRRAWAGEPWAELAEALDGELSTVLTARCTYHRLSGTKWRTELTRAGAIWRLSLRPCRRDNGHPFWSGREGLQQWGTGTLAPDIMSGDILAPDDGPRTKGHPPSPGRSG